MRGGRTAIFFTHHMPAVHTGITFATDMVVTKRDGARSSFLISVIGSPYRRSYCRWYALLILPVIVDTREKCVVLLTEPLHKVVVFRGEDDFFLYGRPLLFIKHRRVIHYHTFVVRRLVKLVILCHEIIVSFARR